MTDRRSCCSPSRRRSARCASSARRRASRTRTRTRSGRTCASRRATVGWFDVVVASRESDRLDGAPVSRRARPPARRAVTAGGRRQTKTNERTNARASPQQAAGVKLMCAVARSLARSERCVVARALARNGALSLARSLETVCCRSRARRRRAAPVRAAAQGVGAAAVAQALLAHARPARVRRRGRTRARPRPLALRRVGARRGVRVSSATVRRTMTDSVRVRHVRIASLHHSVVDRTAAEALVERDHTTHVHLVVRRSPLHNDESLPNAPRRSRSATRTRRRGCGGARRSRGLAAIPSAHLAVTRRC